MGLKLPPDVLAKVPAADASGRRPDRMSATERHWATGRQWRSRDSACFLSDAHPATHPLRARDTVTGRRPAEEASRLGAEAGGLTAGFGREMLTLVRVGCWAGSFGGGSRPEVRFQLVEVAMSKRAAAGLAGAVLIAVSSWALAQPGPAVPKKAESDGSRFVVAPMGTTAVLAETMTGKTWVLHPSADGRPGAWLPAVRFDDPDEAAKWFVRQEHLKRELAREGEGRK